MPFTRRGMEDVTASPSKKRKGLASFLEGEEITVKIDRQFLHCGICSDPLDREGLAFECDNGHIICSACDDKYDKSCPDCFTGSVNRCIVLEHIVEGLRMPCPFSASGCKEFVSRAEKPSHVDQCVNAPLECLVPGCSWSGPRDLIIHHVRLDHGFLCGSQDFYYNKVFSVCLGRQEPLHLLSGKDGRIFALLIRDAPPSAAAAGGSTICLVCVRRRSVNGVIYEYDLEVNRGRSSVTLKSVPYDWKKYSEMAQEEAAPEFLFVPRHFTGESTMTVKVRIRKI